MFYKENEVCEHAWRLKVQWTRQRRSAKSGWVIQMLAKQTRSFSYLSSVQRQKLNSKLLYYQIKVWFHDPPKSNPSFHCWYLLAVVWVWFNVILLFCFLLMNVRQQLWTGFFYYSTTNQTPAARQSFGFILLKTFCSKHIKTELKSH